MGRFAGSYHPDMGELGITGFDWDGMITTAKDTALENMREIYQWDPGTMEGDGPFSWLFEEFEKVETEFTDFETRIKGWKDRLEQALLGEQEGTQEAMMLATKGLTSQSYGRSPVSDMPAPRNLVREVLEQVVAQPVEQYVEAYSTGSTGGRGRGRRSGTDMMTSSEMDLSLIHI